MSCRRGVARLYWLPVSTATGCTAPQMHLAPYPLPPSRKPKAPNGSYGTLSPHPLWRTASAYRLRGSAGGCGGLPARGELVTGVEGTSSRPVRRIVLWSG
jgi:hypothetical protein